MYKLWRGNLDKGYYEIQLQEGELVICWYAADTLHAITDERKWTVEDNVLIRPFDLEARSAEEEREAKRQVNLLRLKQSIASKVEKALKEGIALNEVPDRQNPLSVGVATALTNTEVVAESILANVAAKGKSS